MTPAPTRRSPPTIPELFAAAVARRRDEPALGVDRRRAARLAVLGRAGRAGRRVAGGPGARWACGRATGSPRSAPTAWSGSSPIWRSSGWAPSTCRCTRRWPAPQAAEQIAHCGAAAGAGARCGDCAERIRGRVSHRRAELCPHAEIAQRGERRADPADRRATAARSRRPTIWRRFSTPPARPARRWA